MKTEEALEIIGKEFGRLCDSYIYQNIHDITPKDFENLKEALSMAVAALRSKQIEDEELNKSELRKICPMFCENGICTAFGAFCTSVNNDICVGLHKSYEVGRKDSSFKNQQNIENNPCINCVNGWGSSDETGVKTCHENCEKLKGI